MRKYIIASACIISALLMLASCGKATDATTQYTPRQIALAIAESQELFDTREPMLPDDEHYEQFLSEVFTLNTEKVKDGAVFYSVGVLADEIAVLLFEDRASAQEAGDTLAGYLERRADIFRGYAPAQTAIVEDSIVAVHGDYVALLICEEARSAESAFLACFTSNPPGLSGRDEPPQPTVGHMSGDTQDNAGGKASGDGEDRGLGEPAGTPPDAGASGTPKPSSDGTLGSPSTQPPEGQTSDPDDPADPAGPTGAVTAAASDTPSDPNSQTGQTDLTNPTKPAGTTTPATTSDPAAPATPADPDENPVSGADDTATPDPAGGIYTDEPDENEYSREAILNAWNSGDTSSLALKNKAVLNSCAKVISQIINDDMSEIEKEWAINDWIVKNTQYDPGALSNSPFAKPDPNNSNAYGVMVKGVAICYGYTETFQLFMDMLGIECISVDGWAGTNRPHAWNMVRIDGQWYCVDVTWNDPIGSSTSTNYKYFNVTSEFMKKTDHQWDESVTPVA